MCRAYQEFNNIYARGNSLTRKRERDVARGYYGTYRYRSHRKPVHRELI